MTVSEELFSLVGFFEKYRESGGVVSPRDVQFLTAHLSAAAHYVKAMEVAHRSVSSEFDDYILKYGGDADVRPKRVFQIIEGGAA